MSLTKRKSVFLMCLVGVLMLLTLGIFSAGAQSINQELITFYEGDLWTWQPGGTPEQITEWGYNGGPVISRNGSLIAYRSVASEAIEEGNAYAGDPPSNIYIMTVANQYFERIAHQSAVRVYRSSPVWSPDGTKLAWTEKRGEELIGADVVIYDTEGGSTRTVATIELGFQDGGLSMPMLQWGDGGLARILTTYENATADDSGAMIPNMYWEIVNPDSGAIERIEVRDASNPDMTIRTWFWAQHQGEDHIVFMDGDGAWYVLTPGGNRQTLMNPPMLVRENGTNETMLVPYTYAGEHGLAFGWEHHVNDMVQILPYAPPTIGWGQGFDPVLSPDERYVAWNESGTVNVWDQQTGITDTLLTRVPRGGMNFYVGPMLIAWAPMHWITDGVISSMTVPDGEVIDNAPGCTMATQLSVGMTVEVAAGQEPNRVRSEPSLSASRLGLLFPGEAAVVQEGPVCADGLTWWRVSWGGADGWTAEGSGGVYWLIPAE